MVILGTVAWRNTSKQIHRTREERPSPSRKAFVAMMAPDVSIETAEFLWDAAIMYLAPRLTPHPEDHLLNDLPIYEDNWSMEWPR